MAMRIIYGASQGEMSTQQSAFHRKIKILNGFYYSRNDFTKCFIREAASPILIGSIEKGNNFHFDTRRGISR